MLPRSRRSDANGLKREPGISSLLFHQLLRYLLVVAVRRKVVKLRERGQVVLMSFLIDYIVSL